MVRRTEFEVLCESSAPEVSRLTPVGELDIASTPALERAVHDALKAGSSHVVLDLSKLGFVDSSGLRTFLVLRDRSRSEGWRLTLARPSDPVRSILEITGSGKALDVHEDWPSP